MCLCLCLCGDQESVEFSRRFRSGMLTLPEAARVLGYANRFGTGVIRAGGVVWLMAAYCAALWVSFWGPRY